MCDSSARCTGSQEVSLPDEEPSSPAVGSAEVPDGVLNDEVPEQVQDPGWPVIRPLERYGPCVGGMEVFSQPRVMPYLKSEGLTTWPSIDTLTGHDLRLRSVQLEVLHLAKCLRPKFLALWPP